MLVPITYQLMGGKKMRESRYEKLPPSQLLGISSQTTDVTVLLVVTPIDVVVRIRELTVVVSVTVERTARTRSTLPRHPLQQVQLLPPLQVTQFLLPLQ